MKIKSIEFFYSNEKKWVKVNFDNNQIWIPAFNDIGKIIYLIGQCEDEKYFINGGRGLDLTREFLEEAILFGTTYEEFCKSKGIPIKK